MAVLTRVRAQRMLGQFDHTIDFPESWEFVIVYGPNGVGKTKLLEAVHALITLSTATLSRIPFATLELRFSDSTVLMAEREPDQDVDGAATNASPLRLTLFRDEIVIAAADIEAQEHTEFTDYLLNETMWRPVDDEYWEDRSDGELVTFAELQSRYGRRAASGYNNSAIPSPIREYLRSVDTHLIETQRLITITLPRSRPVYSSAASRRLSQRTTVSAYSEDLKRRLGRALAQNSRTTQQLDRTFPRRILENPAPLDVDDEMIRKRYEDQNALRKRLAGIAVVGGESDLPLPQRVLADWERHVLWTSLADTDAKLSSFDEILSKITLLEDIVNRRFLGKTMVVNSDDGLMIRRNVDGRQLSPESLSSGEQHELILIYDLLFNARPGTVVLLDEPEISLHVAWQQQFLDDIIRVSHLSELRFVVATHSPQIINKWWDRTVQLGPEAAD